MGEDNRADGEDDGHGADHERSVRDGGELQAAELHEELERNAEERAEEQGSPLTRVEVGAMGDEEGKKAERGEGEAVEHHGTDAHLCEGDLAEVKTAAPERAGECAGEETDCALIGGRRHSLVSHLLSRVP